MAEGTATVGEEGWDSGMAGQETATGRQETSGCATGVQETEESGTGVQETGDVGTGGQDATDSAMGEPEAAGSATWGRDAAGSGIGGQNAASTGMGRQEPGSSTSQGEGELFDLSPDSIHYVLDGITEEFCKSLDPDKLIRRMLTKHHISGNEVEEIDKIPRTDKRVERFLAILKTCTPEAYMDYRAAVYEFREDLFEHMLHLEYEFTSK